MAIYILSHELDKKELSPWETIWWLKFNFGTQCLEFIRTWVVMASTRFAEGREAYILQIILTFPLKKRRTLDHTWVYNFNWWYLDVRVRTIRWLADLSTYLVWNSIFCLQEDINAVESLLSPPSKVHTAIIVTTVGGLISSPFLLSEVGVASSCELVTMS